ncbi:hypothetical protein Tco_0488431 [Tanacetum coccineum]
MGLRCAVGMYTLGCVGIWQLQEWGARGVWLAVKTTKGRLVHHKTNKGAFGSGFGNKGAFGLTAAPLGNRTRVILIMSVKKSAVFTTKLRIFSLPSSKRSVQTHIPSTFEQVAEKQTQQNKKMVKHMNRKFNISYAAECVCQSLKVIIDDTAKGEKIKKDENANPTSTQGEHQSATEEDAANPAGTQGEHKVVEENVLSKPKASSVNKDTSLVLHQIASMKTTEDDLDNDELDKQPLSKRFKISSLIPKIPTPIPLNFIIPEHLLEPVQQ